MLTGVLELCHIDGSIFSLERKRNVRVQCPEANRSHFGGVNLAHDSVPAYELPFPINEPQNKVHQFSRSKHLTVSNSPAQAYKWTSSASRGSLNVLDHLFLSHWPLVFFGVSDSRTYRPLCSSSFELLSASGGGAVSFSPPTVLPPVKLHQYVSITHPTVRRKQLPLPDHRQCAQ